MLVAAAVFSYNFAMFAIVDILGFQERVKVGDILKVPTLPVEKGKKVTFDRVLLLGKDSDAVTVGAPYVAGAAVEAEVVGHGRHDKIRVYKMRRRKRYRRTHGHRQAYTEIAVREIRASAAVEKS